MLIYNTMTITDVKEIKHVNWNANGMKSRKSTETEFFPATK